MKASVVHVFRPYVAGRSLNSMQALDNLKAHCRQHLPGGHEIEAVAILREAEQALREGIVVTPSLARVRPEPAVRLVGNLGQKRTVLATLGLETTTT